MSNISDGITQNSQFDVNNDEKKIFDFIEHPEGYNERGYNVFLMGHLKKK